MGGAERYCCWAVPLGRLPCCRFSNLEDMIYRTWCQGSYTMRQCVLRESPSWSWCHGARCRLGSMLARCHEQAKPHRAACMRSLHLCVITPRRCTLVIPSYVCVLLNKTRAPSCCADVERLLLMRHSVGMSEKRINARCYTHVPKAQEAIAVSRSGYGAPAFAHRATLNYTLCAGPACAASSENHNVDVGQRQVAA